MINTINSGSMRNIPIRTKSNSFENDNGLTFREREVLSQIQDKVFSAMGVPVKINEGQRSDQGLTIAFIGMTGASASAERTPFYITRNMLSEMAKDENRFNKWMSQIQQNLSMTNEIEAGLQANRNKTEQEDIERKTHNMRVRMMSALDFWNGDNQNKPNTTSRTPIQQAIERYEQMLLVKN